MDLVDIVDMVDIDMVDIDMVDTYMMHMDMVEIDMQGHKDELDMSEKVAHVDIDIPKQCCHLELCCKLTINEKMDKFIQQENSLPQLDLRCKECSKNICNECLMENSKMSLIQKKLFLKTFDI